MVNFAVPNVTIPFDLLTNEQREAIYLIMTGDGFRNPLKEKIIKAREIVVNEINIVSNIQIHPYSQTLLTEQQITLVKYHLNTIVFWLNALELHSDKLSGSESGNVGDLMQRLSVAGLYTKTMKSITGMDNEQYSLIFGSLTSLGESVINNLSKLTFCEGSSNFCDIDTNNSGVEGIAHAIEVYPVTVDSMNQCLFPKIIERLKNLIDLDEENFCKARRIIERYSYGTKIIESLENDPIFGEAIKNVFATPQLKEALIAIRDSQNTPLESDEILMTDKFFPEFQLGTGDCLVEDQLIHYGIQGVTGYGGGVGATGSPGLPGPVGDCGCGGFSGEGGVVVGGECDCSQGGDGVGCCCVCDGYGVQATAFQCQHYGGVWYGVGSSCENICIPSGDCIGDNDCGVGEICCGAQCIVECALGGCPPCPTCVEGYTQCGTQCCQDNDPVLGIVGQVCCGDVCVAPCVDIDTGVHSCPDCQGICCPPFTSCCGGDGCCPDGSCCQSECCEAGTQNTDCDNGGECQCCEIGSDFTSKCCSGECCSQILETGEWQTCCGAAGCCDPNKCCNNNTCCPDGEVCCTDDFGIQECIPEGHQCNCPDGSLECDVMDGGGLLCCLEGQECCTKTDGTKYCCDGECCNDNCCLGKCMDIGNGDQCCGILEGYDYGGFPPPNCTACEHPSSEETHMCFCLEGNGDFDLDCSTCPHCPCSSENFRPECPLTPGYEYGVNCFCPLGMQFDFFNCECDCPSTSVQPCESPWSDQGDANEYDPCWHLGGFCCDEGTPECCGWLNGAKNCYESTAGGQQCCEVGGQGGVGPSTIECREDSGNWLCEQNENCCGGWRYDYNQEIWNTIGWCCDPTTEDCKHFPNADVYNNEGNLQYRGVYACCETTGNAVDGGPLFGCSPEELGDEICRTCPCSQKQLWANDPDGGGLIAVCCDEEFTNACVEEDGTVHCWDIEDCPECGCCDSPVTDEIVWSELGCCTNHNTHLKWIQWNQGQPIAKSFLTNLNNAVDGCPCGCEDSTGGGLYNSDLEVGDLSACQVACPEVLAGFGIGNSYIDHRCGAFQKTIPGHVCECRTFNPDVDCPIDGDRHECCCSDPTTPAHKTYYLHCRDGIIEHPNSCGKDDVPGEVWCLQCEGTDPCEECCYRDDNLIHCGTIHRDAIGCAHPCLGSINYPGVYGCGDPSGYGNSETTGDCTTGCENGLLDCLEGGGDTPKKNGEDCSSECHGCNEGVALAQGGGQFTTPTSGSCWFDNHCSSFDIINYNKPMIMGGTEIHHKSATQMCEELGGVWDERNCDQFIPKDVRDVQNAITNYKIITEKEQIRKNALQHGAGQLLKQYPNKTLDDIIGAKKKYTPVFDSTGNLIKTKIELIFGGGPIGGQSEISTPTTVTQTVTNYPIQFQLINFVADEKLKTETRTDSITDKDTKSKISKAELVENKELGEAGAEIANAETIVISGSLTAAITNDGTIGEGLLISFVSGSNIKLSTNESNNIIRISLDDIYLNELIDVSDNEPNFGDVLQWKLQEGGSTGQWAPVSPNVGVTGPTGPIGGSDKQILFNEGGAASGSDNLKYDYSTNTVEINAGVEFGSGFTFSGTANMQNQPVVQAQLKDYTETVYNHGNVIGTPLLINVENGNVQTLTKAHAAGSLLSCTITDAPTGSVSMTLIITNGGSADGITFPTAIWAGGNVPSYSGIGTDIITLNTIDGGTSWYGFVGGLGFTG